MLLKRIIFLILFYLFTSCINYYHIKKNKEGETIVDENLYSFKNKMSNEDAKVIDTLSLYFEVKKELYINENIQVLKFHNDGTFEKKNIKYFNSKESKESIYYGGRFKLEGKKITIEKFYPSSGAKTNYYVKKISHGKVYSDTIKLKIFDVDYIYIKKSLEAIYKI